MNAPPNSQTGPNNHLAETVEVLRGMVAESEEIKRALGAPLTDVVSDWLAQQYALAARERLAEVEGPMRWETLRALAQDWAALRRGDHRAARLQLEREQLDLLRANSQTHTEEEFWKWTKRPEIREKLFPKSRGGISKETLEKIQRELRLL